MRRLTAILCALVLVVGAAPVTRASLEAIDVCVTIYENADTAHDKWTKCGPNNSLGNANLTGDITGLGGSPLCNTQWWPAAGNDWNDCVSGVNVDIDAAHRVVFYWNANYSGRTLCTDGGSGFHPLGTADNDQFSSWRVLSGDC